MEDKRDLNEYLYYEFSVDGDEAEISDTWPFELSYLGIVEEVTIYEFEEEGKKYYAFSPEHDFYPTAGMLLDDLRLQMKGSDWIGNHDPITLETVFLGDESVPKTMERQRAIRQLAYEALGNQEEFTILQGLYLRSIKSYLALIETNDRGALIVGNKIEPMLIEFSEASPWRRLSLGIGRLLSEGRLNELKGDA